MGNNLKAILFFILFILMFYGTKSIAQDTIVIGNIYQYECEIVYSHNIIKQELAHIYGSGTIDSLAIETSFDKFTLIGFGTDDDIKFIIGHELFRIGDELVHYRTAIATVHSCTSAGNCSSCSYRRDGLNNIVGCDCSATIPPLSSGYCNHNIEQRLIHY